MPDTRTICYYAMYVIGEVESRWDWTAINYNDPITVGMMQWYGTRAAGLLNRVREEMPSAYPNLAPSLRASLESHSATDLYWTSRYLTRDEGNSIVRVFQAQENHVIQENQAIADFESYIPVLERWGMSTTYPKPLIYAMSMYHQNPTYAGQVIGSAGGSATLEKLHTTCLNHGVLGQYSNRYNTIYNRLRAWDGESDPPDFGQIGDEVNVPSNNPSIETKPSSLGYILQKGNVLVLYGLKEYKDGVTFYPAGVQRWVNGFNANGTPIEGGNTGGGTPEPETNVGEQIITYARSVLGRFTYSNGAGRLDPETSGVTDCSGFVWWCYHHIAGIDLGTWTGTQSSNGREIWRGYSLSDIPWSLVEPADILLMARDSSSLWGFDAYYNDAQLCTGNPNETIGAGGSPNPQLLQGGAIDVYGGSAGFMIRRVL